MTYNCEIVYEGNDGLLNKVDDFVSTHPNGNIFQSKAMFDLYSSIENNTPFIIVVLKNGQIVGSLLSVIMEEPGILKSLFSKRCIIEGGPLILGEEIILHKILEIFNIEFSKSFIYSEFRNQIKYNDNFISIFNKYGWCYSNHLNILIDLNKSEELLWEEVHSKRRNEIRRAKKEETSFMLSNNKNDIKETYNILEEVYNRAKLPFPNIDFFYNALDILGEDNFKFFLALYDGKVIGTMYTLCYKDKIYDWYAGSYKKYYKKYPNDLIPWGVFLWGKENNYKIFDFGGAGKPSVPYGVRDYKKKFGGELVDHGRFKKIHKPKLYKVGEFGLKMMKKIN